MTGKTLLFGIAAALISSCSVPVSKTAMTPVPSPNYATAPLNLSTPENTAYSVMIAMYRGDANMVDQIFAPGGDLRRVSDTGEIDPNGLPRWRDWIATLEIGYAHEELFDISVERYGTLATVWAPFVIRVDGKLVGCGVNQFTMANIENQWRIVSGIDVQAPKDECESFKEDYQRGS